MVRVDPYKNFRFILEIDGIIQAGFTECTGLGSSVEVVEYREGGDPTSVRKLRGRVSASDVVLKWGITDSTELYEWHREVIDGKPLEEVRKNGSVVLLDDAGQEKIRWNFFTGWPSKYDPPEFNATSNDVAIESLTIACERIERAF